MKLLWFLMPSFQREMSVLRRAIRPLRRFLAPDGSRRQLALHKVVLPTARRFLHRSRARPVTALPTRIERPTVAKVDARILILSLAHIGDFVLSLRAIDALRRAFPSAQFTIVCGTWNEDWARELGWFDEVIPFDFFSELNRDWARPGPDKLAEFSGIMRGLQYDIAVDLRHDIDTRGLLYRAKAAFRAGFVAPPESGMPAMDLVHPSVEGIGPMDKAFHAEARLLALVDAVIRELTERPLHPIHALVTGRQRVERPFAVFSLGAGDVIRQWPISRFAVLGKELIEKYDLDVVILGGKAEVGLAAELQWQLPPARTRLSIGAALRDVPDLIAGTSLFVGHGSGMTHLAAELGVPTIAILAGVSRTDVWKPIGKKCVALIGATPCSPCYLRHPSDCAYGVACMKEITPSFVMSAIESLLDGPSGVEQRSDRWPPIETVEAEGAR